ncbi:hypothetical protein J437_LFUL012785 [Ladona fulva]|uniref:BTB domain-containing protein n=1 Tax=Ladona fulva TaxID=123851 RepID=A0A8K0P573_LADFU|nr:hypothetical protein J437_LFUL012785 [Ladona fulva]
MHALATAHESRLESVIDQLLQDFLQVWPDDCSSQFVDDCLPLLFNIFRYSKNEGTTLLLADIFSTCYGWGRIEEVKEGARSGGARIDPSFVNNPELSDVQFRVEGQVFYAHKIVLITSSPRFRSMLGSKSCCEGNPPVVQINDIRYDIFQMVMQYLYKGGCGGSVGGSSKKKDGTEESVDEGEDSLEVEQQDVLELMAAANFFQLDGLLRFCEARCSKMVDLDNIVSMYIHAKVSKLLKKFWLNTSIIMNLFSTFRIIAIILQVYNATRLLEYCQGFLLQNMVALLTYDDSVKRLLFGKRLHNHDVLSALLVTLQTRIRSRNASGASLVAGIAASAVGGRNPSTSSFKPK